MNNIDKVRMELAHKYYALAETKPDLKVDLFSCGEKDIDMSRIQRVSVFKTKQDGILCAATIDGRRPEPRSVTQQQWQCRCAAQRTGTGQFRGNSGISRKAAGTE